MDRCYRILVAINCILLFMGALAQSCFALQTISIADNQTKNITIAANELTRIFIKEDRIQNVRGLEGAYILTKDTALGQIYIKPTPPYQAKPFNLFITTEKGQNFNLFIVAAGIPGQDIELKSTTPSKEAELWEVNSEYSQILVKLIVSMANSEAPAGYSVIYPDKKTKVIKYGNLTLKLQKRYLGKHLYGEVFLIQNNRCHPVTVEEKMFYQNGARAIALLNLTIPAEGQTMLFRVMDNE
jgi:type-F conjugative transfer system secretin TraK